MPFRDGTGPEGRGPLTGRGLGPCGRGFARGGGFGRGMGFRRSGYWDYRRPTKEEEIEMLKADKEAIKADLADIEKRLEELK
ncbi:MAG: DUF5320 domain-containing protein [Candidatus Aenigmarchaeota archaeon]|nr:DUF5320 domain-containing protein [Candidatus Aenigmarchaeota archaeon]